MSFLRRLIVVLLTIGALVAAFAIWTQFGPSKSGTEARQATARSAAALKEHNASDAREWALTAIRGGAGNAEAHLALAKAMLALGDGIGAEAELRRSIEAGGDAKLMPQLRAHAFLLQGDEGKAFTEAARTAPPFRAYALRIQAHALSARGEWAKAASLFDQSARLAPLDPDTWSEIGRFRLSAGDVAGANLAAQRALALDRGHLEALRLRGELIRNQYGLLAALPWFEAALKRDPRDHATLIEYAATLGDAGRSIDALAITRRALAVRPASPQAFYLQSVVAARAGNLELARSLLAKTGGAIDSVPGMLLMKGVLDLQAGDYEQAIAKLKALVDVQPMNIAGRRLLAGAMLRRDLAPAAMDLLQGTVTRSDADSYTLLLAARGIERLGDRDKAAGLIDRSTQSISRDDAVFSPMDSIDTLTAQADEHPDDPGAQLPLLRGLYAKGDFAAGLRRAQGIAARNANVPTAQMLLGDALMLGGSAADAVPVYKHAADLRFDGPTMLRLVEALEATGKNEEAANVLALFLSQNPMDATALRLSARAQLAAGEFDAAIDSLEQVRFQIGDGDAALNADLALAYSGAGASDTAEEFAEAAYALAPASPMTANAYGWVLYQNGDLPHAAEMMRKAIRLAPDQPEPRWRLAQVYAELGNRPGAASLATAALADPRFTQRAEATALLARLR
ncbi:tetratricopeptide repeat protein [Sphingomonas sp. S2-65]|uniref:tetratricopeptide repeat protein n=1 Tax=Sphingomonas sp. S2-65 TaxID=2903960 RepID=UPI001F3C7CAF|nr:tetratricopeptide repeat protein [Sphingomonas sp. S2-65]UYY57795.1 tetratricopeptide repeat protein [Sphingomonas sp. S2-65]